MKKSYKLNNLDCAHCAKKMEDAISKINGVKKASVNFIMQKMTIEADDDKFDSIVKEAAGICKKIEPDCELII